MMKDIIKYDGFKEIRKSHYDKSKETDDYSDKTVRGHISAAAPIHISRQGARIKAEGDSKSNEFIQSKKQFEGLNGNMELKELYEYLIASMKSYYPSDKKTKYLTTKEAVSQSLEKKKFIDLRVIFNYKRAEDHDRKNDIAFFSPCPIYLK